MRTRNCIEAWLLRFGILLMVLQVNRGMAADENADKRASVQYRLSFRQAETHRVDIELSIPTDGNEQIELMMPVWTPGSYLVREYARQVEQVTAYNGLNQQELEIRKSDKNHWLVACQSAEEVVVRYSLYCREMSVRTNWVERDFAFLTGAATFLTRSDMLDHPHLVRIDALPNWPNIATSLREWKSGDPWTRVASSFDELVDSPIVLGAIDIQSFECGGAKHHLATLGGETFWDTPSAVKDVVKIVETEQKLWGDIPYEEYWFLNLATESGGGLEHDNSCVLMTGRWTQRQKSKYLDWLGLVSHEFFHTWNVRRLRPKVLMQYDYNNEQYTQELWVAEGITSYYDDLMVARAGLFMPKEYLDRVSKSIASVQTAPGRFVQSLRDSSFDSWIKFYRPDENANNSRISYYVKGSLVGMLLDTKIRSNTNDQKSLDDVMRLLWKKHRDTGYTNEDFATAVAEVCDDSVKGWLEQVLDSTNELDFDELMAWYGLEWKQRDSDKDKDKEKEPVVERPVYGNVYVGLDLKAEQGRAMVDKVTRDSPASMSGVLAGDELISFDGFRITAEGWNERLNLYRPDDVCKCLVARRGKILELQIRLAAQPENGWTLVRVAKPTEDQEAHWSSWLHIPLVESDAP